MDQTSKCKKVKSNIKRKHALNSLKLEGETLWCDTSPTRCGGNLKCLGSYFNPVSKFTAVNAFLRVRVLENGVSQFCSTV